MADDKTPATAPAAADATTAAPEPIKESAALETAGAFFSRVEAYLVKQANDAETLGTHGEYSSLRGLIATTLATWRTGKPGGAV